MPGRFRLYCHVFDFIGKEQLLFCANKVENSTPAPSRPQQRLYQRHVIAKVENKNKSHGHLVEVWRNIVENS
jgi:hypothetical protein